MTEKNYNPNLKEKKAIKKQTKVENKIVDAPVKKEKTEEKKVEETKQEIKKESENVSEKEANAKSAENKTEKKETKKPVKKIKKDFAVVNADNAKISEKYSIEICRFIKNKRIGDAVRDLEEVAAMKKSVPMRGEYAHRRGAGKIASGAGKYPVNAAKAFIILVKSLGSNATANDMDEPYIAEASANKAPRPRGRFGRWERKRCHIRLVAKELKVKDKKKNSEGKK